MMRRIISRVIPLTLSTTVVLFPSVAFQDDSSIGDSLVNPAIETLSINKDLRLKPFNSHRKLENMVILPGTAIPTMAADIANQLGVKLGEVDIRRFSDGELYCLIKEPIRGKDVFIIQTCAAPVNDNIMELLLTTSCARRAGANRVTAVVPYFGYRHHRRGSPISSKHTSRFMWSTAADFAKMLLVMGVDRVISVDLQRPGQGQEACFFDNSIPVETIFSTNLMVDYFHENIPLQEPVVIVSPDSDFAKKARKFQKGLLAKGKLTQVSLAAFMHTESHTGPVDPNASEFLGNVAGADVIVVDDVVDSAGTLAILCRRLRKEGARNVYLCASHGIFTGNSLERIRLSPVERVIITDSIPAHGPTGTSYEDSKITQVSIAPLLARLIEAEYYRSVGYKEKEEEKEVYVID